MQILWLLLPRSLVMYAMIKGLSNERKKNNMRKIPQSKVLSENNSKRIKERTSAPYDKGPC